MASTTETGHSKNVANLDVLITFVSAYGTAYNPSNPALSLQALQSLAGNAKSANNAVNAAIPAYSNAVAAREQAFEPLSKRITRVLNALKATDVPSQVIDNAKTLTRKIQGTRATPKKTDAEKTLAKTEGKESTEISSSQMSFNSRLDNLDKLIQLLSSLPLYAPNEADLQVSALTSFYNQLTALNTAAVNAIAPLSNARLARNTVLYNAQTGLVATALDTKSYVKSLYGASSPEYKQISKLEFKTVKV